MKRIGLFLEPLDVLFFRDGHAFNASVRVNSGLPTPQTLAGAIRTKLMRQFNCDFERLKTDLNHQSLAQSLANQSPELQAVGNIQFTGPWLARQEKNTLQTYYPAPANFRQDKNTNDLKVLKPYDAKKLPGWEIDGLMPLWLEEKAELEKVSGYLSQTGLQQFLKGQTPDKTQLLESSELYILEPRTGIGMDPQTQSTQEGLIYAVQMLRMMPSVGFYAEIWCPESLLESIKHLNVFHFGGEGRRVHVQTLSPLEWEENPEQISFQTQTLTTPAPIQEQDWQSNWPICSVAQMPYQIFSGWDLARKGPKPMRYALPAGTVLFYHADQPMPERLVSLEDHQLGWGQYLKGVV